MAGTKATGGDEGNRYRRCIAFAGTRRIAMGEMAEVAGSAKAALEAGATGSLLFFDDETSEPVEFDLRGSRATIRRRAGKAPAPSRSRGPGRPRLGVTAREVTLLPRQWEWLSAQPGGASAALRRLVEVARKKPDPAATRRRALESAYRFMSAMAGNERGFEEATRALFRGDRHRFEAETVSWPVDVREHAHLLAGRAFAVPIGGEVR